MIMFNYSDAEGQVTLEVRSRAEHIEMVLEDFKTFLIHAGYHTDNIEAITYCQNEARQGLPHVRQLDLFKDLP